MDELDGIRKEIEGIDAKMAALFTERMRCAFRVAEYKSKNGKPILDAKREAALLEKNEKYITQEELVPYYRQFLKALMDISKQYQQGIVEEKTKAL